MTVLVACAADTARRPGSPTGSRPVSAIRGASRGPSVADVDDPLSYDAFVIGSAAYMGHWARRPPRSSSATRGAR